MFEQQQRCRESRALLAGGAHLVDVRSVEEFSAGALPGAVNLPLQVMPGACGLLDQATPVVVYCGTGMRSAQAKQLLDSAGLHQVHDLGGLNNLHHC